MLLIGRAMQQNWPDYDLWQTVKFQLRPMTVMALNYCFWIEDYLDLYNSLRDHLDVEGLAMTFNSDEEAFSVLEIVGMFLQDMPIMVYGYDPPSRYPGTRQHWLASVINHIMGDEAHTFDPDVAQFPRASRAPKDFLFCSKVVNVLAASADPNHRQLAAIVAYINNITGLDVVDWSHRGIQESGIQGNNTDWQMPDYIDRVRGNQLFGRLLESLYLDRSHDLAFNPDITLDFVLPLYGAIAVVCSKNVNVAAQSKALIDIVLGNNDTKDEEDFEAQPLYDLIFPEDPADAEEFFAEANKWLGNAEPYTKPIISVSFD
ncbi:hypothetical protein [Herpetosiphon geysericola]|uniref:Uncharacterized protein n=1 Tax=Herpetosiphon geysericola TaxID=70996 RepID=A0A0P6YZX0_9CHLR|nr:hypothetical protein [Herpetosiphon geysericola]KPL90023.1 hypothetical protein SE18_08710 [Herpetosiphon geysericola]